MRRRLQSRHLQPIADTRGNARGQVFVRTPTTTATTTTTTTTLALPLPAPIYDGSGDGQLQRARLGSVCPQPAGDVLLQQRLVAPAAGYL